MGTVLTISSLCTYMHKIEVISHTYFASLGFQTSPPFVGPIAGRRGQRGPAVRTHPLAGSAEGPPRASCPRRSCCCCSSCPSCPGWRAHCLRSCRSPSWNRSTTSPHASSRASGSNPLREEERRADPRCHWIFNLMSFLIKGERWNSEDRKARLQGQLTLLTEGEEGSELKLSMGLWEREGMSYVSSAYGTGS